MTDTQVGTPRQDVVDILKADHREFLDLLTQVLTTADAGERRDLTDTAIAEIMRHAVAEEMYVYPAIEKHLPDGREEAQHDREEHEELVQIMKRLEDADTADPAFIATVTEFEANLRHHIEEEEADQFPRLRAHIPADELVSMGEKVERAKKLAPTRPHPSAPHSELFHKTVGPGVGMIDRLRDKLTGRENG